MTRRWLPAVWIAVALGGCGQAGNQSNLAVGETYEANGQYRAAYIEAKKVLQHDARNGKAWLLLGRASLRLGNPLDAFNDLQEAKNNGIPESQWAIPMGNALLVMQKYADLLKTISPANITSLEDRANVLALRGDAYRDLKQSDSAKQSYQSAIALDANNPNALVGLARLAAAENDLDAANNYAKQALISAPHDARIWIVKGDLAFDAQDYSTAEADYDIAMRPESRDLLPQYKFYALARLADSQVQQGDLEKALIAIHELQEMAPEQPYPHYLHALIDYQQNHFSDATSQLQQVLKVAPDNEPAQVLMGAVSYAQGNFSQTQMYLSNVLGINPQNSTARKLLAITLYREGQSKQALSVLRPIVPGHLSDAELLALIQNETAEVSPQTGHTISNQSNLLNSQLTVASKAIAAGNEEEAIHLLQEFPAGNRSLESNRYSMMVMAYVREKRADEAVRVAAEYVHKDPEDSAAYLLYGTALMIAGNRAQARAEYTKAQQLDPNNLAALMSLGSLDVIEARYGDATNRYKMVLKADPDNASAMNALGRVAALQGHKVQAVNWFKKAINRDPKMVDPYIGLIVLYSGNGQLDEVNNTAKSLASVAPENPVALNALGAVELNAGQYKKAMAPLEKAVTLAPQRALYRTNLARAQILNRDFTNAQKNLSQVIEHDPAQVQAVALLASLKLQGGDTAGALALADMLQKQPSTRTAGFTLEGDIYMAKKSYANAARAYERSLSLDYTAPLVVKTFVALNDAGKKSAKNVLLTWLDKQPDDAASRLLLAQYYLDHDEYSLSAEQFQHVLKLYPSNIVALNNLAWIYTQENNPQALAFAKRAYTLAPNSANVQDTYGWAMTVNGNAKIAIPILLKAAEQAPEVPAVKYHLAVAQAKIGDTTAAKANLQAALNSGAIFPGRAAAEKLYRDLNSG